ncbi:cytochrome P450 [Tilletiaria anomala UBC 951]|uniref:Cytochrome P450 n=1 Tax=Tilletiaria anomala (strain ATCC 24038 / CBS 436.72 / UBC 951) TaxID=1037660 RepID=A0A066V6U0_TILAU|nr:cytochrome P450 [Tilletiaria anomala UBC 951]KDN37462.1 cytochrome P450 [Tilletiaria anomala UBC 951]
MIHVDAITQNGTSSELSSSLIFSGLQNLRQLALPLHITTVLTLFSAVWIGYHFFFHPLRNVPAPFSVKLGLGHFRAWHAWKRDYVWALSDLHERYGPTVRISPWHISTISQEAVSQIYAHGSKFHKSSFYTAFEAIPGQPSLFSDIDPHSHVERRRSIASAYSMNHLLSLEEYVRPCVDKLVEKINSIISKHSKFNASANTTPSGRIQIDKWAHFFAFDAVGELAFGQSFNLLEHASDPSQFMLGVANLSHFGAVSGSLPGMMFMRRWFRIDMYTIYSRLQAYFRKEPFGGQVVRQEAERRVQERFDTVKFGPSSIETTEMRPDLLSRFMAAKHSTMDTQRAKQPFDFFDVLRMSLSIVGAASDTTSSFVTSFFVLLLRHPYIYERLQQEIDESFEEGRLERENITYAQSVKLDYLQACIKETLRIAPPISMSLPRIVPPQGMTINGTHIVGGATIGTAPYIFHRSPDAWGPDAAIYKPERWLNLEDKERGRLERHFLSFGAGSRICIGKNISLMEISILLPTLLASFRFSFTDGTKQNVRDIFRTADAKRRSDTWTGEYESTWFLDARDVWLTVTKR